MSEDGEQNDGITARRLYAALAMSGFIQWYKRDNSKILFSSIANASFRMADMMLEAEQYGISQKKPRA